MDASCATLDRLAPDPVRCPSRSFRLRRLGRRLRPPRAARAGGALAALPDRGDADRWREIRGRLRRGAPGLSGAAHRRSRARGAATEPAALPARPGGRAAGGAAAARGARSRERRHLRPHLRLVPRRAGAVRSVGAVGRRPARQDHARRAGSARARGQAGGGGLFAARRRHPGGAGAGGAGDDRSHVEGMARPPVRADSLDGRSRRHR